MVNNFAVSRGRLAQSGERPPTNPAIRVRDSPTAIRRDFFCGGNYAQPRLLKILSPQTNIDHAIYWTKSGLHNLD